MSTSDKELPYDSLRFDATDAWLMFAIWMHAHGHHLAGGIAMVLLLAILWTNDRAEKKRAASIGDLVGKE